MPTPEQAVRPRRRIVSVASAVLIIVGLVLGATSALVAPANSQLLDTERFVASFGPLGEDPEVQAVITAGVMDAIDSSVDIPALTAPVFDGLASLGLPRRTAAALGLLQAPLNQGLHSLIKTQVEDFVRSPAFARTWAASLRATHTQMLATLRGTSDAAVSIGGTGTLELQLGPIIAEVRERLIANGLTFARVIPTVDRSIVLVEDSALASLPVLYSLVTAVAMWLPWVALALIVAGVLSARNRRRALFATSISTVVIMLILAVGLAVVRSAVSAPIVGADGALTVDAMHVLYDTATLAISEVIITTGTIAGVTALACWLGGDGTIPRALRSGVDHAVASVRSATERHGINGFGSL